MKSDEVKSLPKYSPVKTNTMKHGQTKDQIEPEMKAGTCSSCSSCLARVQRKFLDRIASLFDAHGRMVAHYPVQTIVACVALTLISCLGFLNFTIKSDTLSLWIPGGSEIRGNLMWLNENFPPDTRYHSVILKTVTSDQENGDLLNPEGIQALFIIQKRLKEVNTVENTTWEKSCKKISIPVTVSEASYIGWGLKNLFDFCDEFLTVCMERSILNILSEAAVRKEELSNDEEFIYNLNKTQILSLLNQDGIQEQALKYLGGVNRSSTGYIIGAKATKVDLVTQTNITEALLHPYPGVFDPVTNTTMLFEKDMKEMLLNTSVLLPDHFEMSVLVHRSLGDVINENIVGNYNLLYSGFVIMFFYVLIMLGKLNCVEQRVWLSVSGLCGIVLSSIFCLGFCSAFGLMFTQLHNILPFLMLGIGIDDMFVLVQSYENLSDKEKKQDLDVRFGATLSYAGMAVSVTSVTNIVAFALGATTVIPALRSFCLFCSVGILALFIYTLTFFTACMVLDQRRIDERRDGCIPCYSHGESWAPNNWTNTNWIDVFMKKLARFSTTILMKSIISVVTLGLFGTACYGISQLEQRFEERWLIPDQSYLARWFDDRTEYFSSEGERGEIHFAEFNLSSQQLDRIKNLVIDLNNASDIISKVDPWALHFSQFYNGSLDNEEMTQRLVDFLLSPKGLPFADRFEFANGSRPTCRDRKKEMVMFKIEYQHPLFSGPLEHVPAMNRVKKIIRDSGVEGRVFAKSIKYEFWEVDEILSRELQWSLALALGCVFLIVVFMLANITSAVLVLICVIFTVMDVLGFMYFWGLTIDTTSSMLLIICIGLSVDYSAHIAHGFLEQKLSGKDLELSLTERKKLRAERTLTSIGPAVFYGGLSTMLATVLLAASDYYLFVVFFKVFFLVVLLGLFHGLVFLPVVLCLVGPSHPTDIPPAATTTSITYIHKKGEEEKLMGNGTIEESLGLKELPSIEIFTSNPTTSVKNGTETMVSESQVDTDFSITVKNQENTLQIT